jgi:hypothetical protein
MMVYERRTEPPLTRAQFARRIARHIGAAALLVAGSIVAGTAGYHSLGDLPWIDAFLNSCMLLGGMGPAGELHTDRGKIFASFFALYAGLVFLVCGAVLLTPILHRVMHKFHWDADQQGSVRGRE